jgi:bifunctional non-homologous end joining protein LigD
MPGAQSGGWAGLVRPMLATLARELPADDGSWAAEFKWDGLRAVAYVSGGVLLLRSRLGRDITGTYPDLAGVAGGAGGRQLVLDGEIVASGAGGRPDFAALQRRMHVRRPSLRLAAAVPVTYLVFDVMHIDGRDLLRVPYAQRRARLEDLVLPGPDASVPPSFPGGGPAVLAASREHGLEGVGAQTAGRAHRISFRAEVDGGTGGGYTDLTCVFGPRRVRIFANTFGQ